MPVSLFAQLDQQEDDRLEAWLTENKLDGLLLEQLEARLESTINRAAREETAKRLASLYGQRLLSLEGDPKKLLKRTRELISLYPNFETGRLRVAMLHARYLEAEKRFRNWIQDGAAKGGVKEIEDELRTLDSDLSGALSALLQRSEDLFATGQLSRDRRVYDAQRQTVEAEALHCQFLAGWNSFFLAMVVQNDRQQLLEQAELRFREFLQLDQQTSISDYDARWFDFSSAWHVRAIVGLAAIKTTRNEPTQAKYLYSLIESNAVSRESREAVMRFRLLGHVYSGQFEEATNLLRDRKAIAAMSRKGRVQLWATAIDVMKATGSRELRQMALAGLARNMAGDLLVAELDQEVAGLNADSFATCWVLGYAEFWKSENGLSDSFARSAELLNNAISFADSGTDPNDVARCRYLLAWLMLKRNKFDEAIGMFTEVAAQLASTDPKLASESAWLAAKSATQAGGNDPARLNEAWNRLERFVRAWPDSPHASRASFEKLKIELRSMQPVAAIERLKEIKPDDENYGASLLELAVQHYRYWQANPGEPSFERFKLACRNADSSRATGPGAKLRANFMLMDAVLRMESNAAAFETLQSRCEALLAKAGDVPNARNELLYYQMKHATKLGDSQRSFAYAKKIVETAGKTRFELPALIEMARYQDAILSGKGSSDTNQIAEATKVYQQLSQKLGSDANSLRSSANARVAFARLGELYQLAGKSQDSESVFQSLTELFPGNANYLRHLAVAKSDRDTDAATAIWRRLSAGSEAGSDLWYESKLELARITSASDKESALQLLRQTMQLGGDMPERWRMAFEGAVQELNPGEGR